MGRTTVSGTLWVTVRANPGVAASPKCTHCILAKQPCLPAQPKLGTAGRALADALGANPQIPADITRAQRDVRKELQSSKNLAQMSVSRKRAHDQQQEDDQRERKLQSMERMATAIERAARAGRELADNAEDMAGRLNEIRGQQEAGNGLVERLCVAVEDAIVLLDRGGSADSDGAENRDESGVTSPDLG